MVCYHCTSNGHGPHEIDCPTLNIQSRIVAAQTKISDIYSPARALYVEVKARDLIEKLKKDKTCGDQSSELYTELLIALMHEALIKGEL